MTAQELEDELKTLLSKLKESEIVVKQNLKQVQDKMIEIKEEVEKAQNRMLLCKAKMQGLDIKTAELKKLRPISQGTQMTEEQLHKDPNNVSQLNILPLPETEEDKAVKDLLQSKELAIIKSSVTTMSNVINTTASNVAT